jgi:hypothetical protein
MSHTHKMLHHSFDTVTIQVTAVNAVMQGLNLLKCNVCKNSQVLQLT